MVNSLVVLLLIKPNLYILDLLITHSNLSSEDIVVVSDYSDNMVGAVIPHIFSESSQKGYESRSLSPPK